MEKTCQCFYYILNSKGLGRSFHILGAASKIHISCVDVVERVFCTLKSPPDIFMSLRLRFCLLAMLILARAAYIRFLPPQVYQTLPLHHVQRKAGTLPKKSLFRLMLFGAPILLPDRHPKSRMQKHMVRLCQSAYSSICQKRKT